MRVGTKILSTIVLSSGLVASWSVGSRQVATELVLSNDPLLAPTASAPLNPEAGQETASSSDAEIPTTETQAPTETASSTANPEANSQAPAASPAAPKAPAPAAPAQTETPVAPIETAPVVQIDTIDSDPIVYKYGTLQLRLITSDGLISEISVLQGDQSFGRDAAYRSLAEATIQTQGTNYGNISGSTFTVNAFKDAVTNALAKR